MYWAEESDVPAVHVLVLDTTEHQTSDVLLSPCLGRSELFWQHNRDLHNIKRLVLMLLLKGVYTVLS